jgi:hypothetical protein
LVGDGSVVGTAAEERIGDDETQIGYDPVRQRLAVGRPEVNRVILLDIDPEIGVSGNGLPIASGATAPAAANGTAFGAVDVNSGALQRSFVISNTGEGQLRVTGIASDNAAFSVAGGSALTITSGASATIVLRFDPAVAGAVNATITLSNDDADEGAYRFVVSGTGTGTPTARKVYLPLAGR